MLLLQIDVRLTGRGLAGQVVGPVEHDVRAAVGARRERTPQHRSHRRRDHEPSTRAHVRLPPSPAKTGAERRWFPGVEGSRGSEGTFGPRARYPSSTDRSGRGPAARPVREAHMRVKPFIVVIAFALLLGACTASPIERSEPRRRRRDGRFVARGRRARARHGLGSRRRSPRHRHRADPRRGRRCRSRRVSPLHRVDERRNDHVGDVGLRDRRPAGERDARR